MTAPKKGDRVRIVCEGTATTPHNNGDVLIKIDTGYSAFVPASAVEILPPPVRVGDVATREVLDRLPHLSVIVVTGHALQLFPYQGESRWHYAGDSGAYTSETVAAWGATVLYIPPDPQ